MDIKQGKGIVVSDFHMGRPDAWGETALIEVAQHVLAQKPSLIVLNGDMIEGKEFPGNKEKSIRSVEKSASRIRGLVQVAREENPDCQVVYVFGNHDCRYEVADSLAKISQEFPDNFRTEEALLKVRDTIFTHGDLQLSYDHLPSNAAIVKAGLRKDLEIAPGRSDTRDHDEHGHSSWKHVKGAKGAKGALVKRISNSVIGAVDTVASPIVFPLDQVISTIHRTLTTHDETTGEKLLDGVKNICIGHIHPRHGTVREHEGITFRVTGPATRFSKNTMYLFDVGEKEISNFQTFEQARKADKSWRSAAQSTDQARTR